MWELGNIMSKNKLSILIVDENQSYSLPSNLRGLSLFQYNLSDDNKDFVNNLNNFLQKYNKDEKDYLRLFNKGEYNAAVIAAFRFLEITLSPKCDFARVSLMEALNLLNTNNAEDKEILNKVKDYRKIRNSIVHSNVNIEQKYAKDIISCIEKLCTSINSGNIIVL